eukprot:6460313-Amphidinium_carterae.1
MRESAQANATSSKHVGNCVGNQTQYNTAQVKAKKVARTVRAQKRRWDNHWPQEGTTIVASTFPCRQRNTQPSGGEVAAPATTTKNGFHKVTPKDKTQHCTKVVKWFRWRTSEASSHEEAQAPNNGVGGMLSAPQDSPYIGKNSARHTKASPSTLPLQAWTRRGGKKDRRTPHMRRRRRRGNQHKVLEEKCQQVDI